MIQTLLLKLGFFVGTCSFCSLALQFIAETTASQLYVSTVVFLEEQIETRYVEFPQLALGWVKCSTVIGGGGVGKRKS